MDSRTRNALLTAGAVGLALLVLRRRDHDVTADRAHAARSVTVRADARRIYDVFTQPDRLAALFGGTQMEIVDATPGERFEWRTPKQTPLRSGGSLTFTAAPGSRGTQARLALFVEGPAAHAIAAFERLFGKAPAQLAQETLRDLKALVEAGEIPQAQSTTEPVTA